MNNPFFAYSLWPFFCFFKQKTAYDMRISDWSSDVCSSDLVVAVDEACVQARQGCIVLRGQQPRLAQRRAQGVAEGARESRQGLAGVAVGVLDEQRAVGCVLPRHLGAIDRRFHLQRRLDRRDPVLRVKPAQFREYPKLLPSEHQPAPRQRARQRAGLVARESDEATTASRQDVRRVGEERGRKWNNTGVANQRKNKQNK